MTAIFVDKIHSAFVITADSVMGLIYLVGGILWAVALYPMKGVKCSVKDPESDYHTNSYDTYEEVHSW